MDRQTFEAELKRDGYDEILTGNTQGPSTTASTAIPMM